MKEIPSNGQGGYMNSDWVNFRERTAKDIKELWERAQKEIKEFLSYLALVVGASAATFILGGVFGDMGLGAFCALLLATGITGEYLSTKLGDSKVAGWAAAILLALGVWSAFLGDWAKNAPSLF
jgi:hypothetical protein